MYVHLCAWDEHRFNVFTVPETGGSQAIQLGILWTFGSSNSEIYLYHTCVLTALPYQHQHCTSDART